MRRYLFVLIFILSYRIVTVQALSPVSSVRLSAGLVGLKKVVQGQASFNPPQNSFSFERVAGLKETISHSWNADDSSWRISMRSVYRYTSDGDVSEVKRYLWNATTASWNLRDSSIFSYHAPGKMDENTFYDYHNGVWVEELQRRYAYDGFDSLKTSVSFPWDSIRSDWDTVPYITVSYFYDANGRIDTLIENTMQRQEIVYTYSYLPDGKLGIELICVISSRCYRAVHDYPDPFTEKIAYQDNSPGEGWVTHDSIELTYNNFGVLASYSILSKKQNVWVIQESESIAFNDDNRPMVKMRYYYREFAEGSSEGDGGILLPSRKTVYVYDSLNTVRNYPGFAQKERAPFCRILNGNMVCIDNLSHGLDRTNITIYTATGRVLYTKDVPVHDGTVRHHLNTLVQNGCYFIASGERSFRSVARVVNWR